jgi:methionyl-tRNA synthetase
MSSRSPDGVFYLTTPIYYINGPPHLGHAYTTIVADTMARYRRLAGDAVWFLTGTDEHGDKIAQAAQKAKESPQALADRNSKAFRDQWDALGITYDDFIRTTEGRHARVVQAILQALFDRGEIYFGKYGGQYCFGCERFYTEKEIVDGKCPDHQTPLTYIEEENYFFRMSAYQDWLRRYLEAHPDVVQPDRYRNELLGFLREPLQDLSISRPKSRLEWGIPLPFDDRFVTYVWFDALLNYVSALGGPGDDRFRRYWPHVQHLIGKDILKPHGIYWPCMLRAAGLLRDEETGGAGLPGFARLRVHGYWTLGGGKISKSVGNVVEALALARKYGTDAFRYFVLREMPFGQDANFTEEAFVERLNADLANDLGNLVSRATTLIATHGTKGAPSPGRVLTRDVALDDAFRRTRRVVDEAMAEFAFHRALSAIWEFVTAVNRYVDTEQPWALAKDPRRADRLITVLGTLAEALRCLGILLAPFLPEAAERIRRATGDAAAPRLEAAAFGRPWRVPEDLAAVQRLTGLFPRVESRPEAPSPVARASGPAPGAGGPAARITIDEFKRVDLRVAEVVDAEPVPKSKKLLKLTVRLADETRTLVAGIAEHYRPEALVGRKVVIVANLEPATLMGVTSNGMVLAGSAGETLALVVLDRDLPPGAKVR